jgi:Targeting protein for Xklp2 (TPX2) domain
LYNEKKAAMIKLIEKEEVEVKVLRAQLNFKATPIKHFAAVANHIEPKTLTIPQSLRLHTEMRAQLKDRDINCEV